MLTIDASEKNVLPKDVAEKMLAFLGSQVFLDMFIQVHSHEVHLKVIASTFLKNIPDAMKAVELLKKRDQQSLVGQSAFDSLADALARLQKIFRFIACVLAMYPPDLNLSATDVAWLATYQGKDVLERQLQNAIEESDFWQRECDDIVRHASTTPQLRPELERLCATLTAWDEHLHLAGGGISGERLGGLEAAVDSLMKVRKGLRRADVKEVDDLALGLFVKLSKAVMAGEVEPRTRLVKCLMEGLSVLGEMGGTESLRDSLRSWSSKNSSAIVLLDLVDMAENAEKRLGGVVDMGDVQALMARLKPSMTLSSDEQRWAAAYLLVAGFRAVLTEAG